MPWNWQLAAWPDFRFDLAATAVLEKRFLLSSGALLRATSQLDEDDHNQIRIQLLSEEALLTSKIEGELLDRESVQSSLQRHFGLKGDRRRVPPAERGISELLIDLYRNFDRPLSKARLERWHASLMQGRADIKVGAYRSTKEAMQIVSGPIHDPVVHFEAPPANRVGAEMKCFIAWWKQSGELPALARAAVAHLHFESIHPFEDGNGRIGRALSELALSQSVEEPLLLALSRAIEEDRKRYYEELQVASRTLEIDRWVRYFSQVILEAQQVSIRSVEFLVAKAHFLDRFREGLNARQEKALLRIFREGIGGFEGGLSAANYRAITKAPPATATRDLASLVAMGALRKTGERKHTRYYLDLDS